MKLRHLSPIGFLLTAPLLAQSPDGTCDPLEALRGRCFTTPSGFVFEVITGPFGEFPVLDGNGDSVFSYRVTGPGFAGGSCAGVHDISHVSIELPVCDPAAFGIQVLGAQPPVEIKNPGQGDPSCGFGVGNASTRVVKWDFGVDCSEATTYSITVAGVVPARPISMMVKAAGNCDGATILGPSCDPEVVPLCENSIDCPCGIVATNGGGCPNSTGDGGVLSWSGSTSVAADDFRLEASNLPPNQFALFLMARSYQPETFTLGAGLLCIGGPGTKIVRIKPIAQTSPQGTVSTQPGLIALSCNGTLALPEFSCITPGSSFDFQLYYRDMQAVGNCADLTNLTNALRVTFAP